MGDFFLLYLHMNQITNRRGTQNSLQISVLKDVPAGDFEPGIIFLLKNITDNTLTLQVKTACSKEYIETTIAPGWNPELLLGVKGVAATQLQYGY